MAYGKSYMVVLFQHMNFDEKKDLLTNHLFLHPNIRTCCVLAERALQPKSASRWYTKDEIDKETTELEESMLFVIDEDGATKIVKRRHWGAFVRRMR